MDNYKSVSEIAQEWGMSERGVRNLCSNGKIKGATKLGNIWAIPSEACKPSDGRIISGKYVNWRKVVK